MIQSWSMQLLFIYIYVSRPIDLYEMFWFWFYYYIIYNFIKRERFSRIKNLEGVVIAALHSRSSMCTCAIYCARPFASVSKQWSVLSNLPTQLVVSSPPPPYSTLPVRTISSSSFLSFSFLLFFVHLVMRTCVCNYATWRSIAIHTP